MDNSNRNIDTRYKKYKEDIATIIPHVENIRMLILTTESGVSKLIRIEIDALFQGPIRNLKRVHEMCYMDRYGGFMIQELGKIIWGICDGLKRLLESLTNEYWPLADYLRDDRQDWGDKLAKSHGLIGSIDCVIEECKHLLDVRTQGTPEFLIKRMEGSRTNLNAIIDKLVRWVKGDIRLEDAGPDVIWHPDREMEVICSPDQEMEVICSPDQEMDIDVQSESSARSISLRSEESQFLFTVSKATIKLGEVMNIYEPLLNRRIRSLSNLSASNGGRLEPLLDIPQQNLVKVSAIIDSLCSMRDAASNAKVHVYQGRQEHAYLSFQNVWAHAKEALYFGREDWSGENDDMSVWVDEWLDAWLATFEKA
ncbi:MAG: hypothetical protein M1834_009357 [Cirrosporium novae-zelandiae]|nr:MAG: hypothetical protein M1834_009357 [Cirrosporium novae-zelandiae]